MKSEERWQYEDYAVSHVRLRQVAKLVQSLDPGTVLDLGCHNGQLARLLPGVDYIGVDFVEHGTPDFPFIRCNFNETGLPDELPSGDVVVASGILEYIEDLPGFLSSVRRHVKPGGAFVATYFNMNHISRLAAMMRGRSFEVHPDWRGFHSPRDIGDHLQQADFVVERRIPSTTTVRGPVELRQTVDQAVVLSGMRPWSTFLAEQLIFVARPAASARLGPVVAGDGGRQRAPAIPGRS